MKTAFVTVIFIGLLRWLIARPEKLRSGGGEGGSGNRFGNNQRTALESWASSMVPEIDYDPMQWAIAAHSKSPSDYFEKYAKKLTTVFAKHNAFVNFVSVGACDGTTDPVIKYQFLKQSNWRGVFVEPISNNFNDLRDFLEKNGASSRSHLIKAAATMRCENATIMMERPLYEEKSKNSSKPIPHWLRRQIGSIVPAHRDHARPEWTLEEVRCLTGREILEEWTDAFAMAETNKWAFKSLSKPKRRRPHVLKIDVEGHDYEVLMSFVLDDTPSNELPLMIEFEAKSIAKKFPQMKEHLEKLGYAVSKYAADGFALLKAEKILEGLAELENFRKQPRAGRAKIPE